MSFLKGEELTLKESGSNVTINWQQEFNQRGQTYVLCHYTTRTGAIVPVYIQHNYPIKEKLAVDSSLQYGSNDDALFFVYHNKEQTPYQHRFSKTSWHMYLYTFNALLKFFRGMDVTWLAGEYLRDVK